MKPSSVRKTGQLPAPAAFEPGISGQGRTSESDWSAVSAALFGAAELRKNRLQMGIESLPVIPAAVFHLAVMPRYFRTGIRNTDRVVCACARRLADAIEKSGFYGISGLVFCYDP